MEISGLPDEIIILIINKLDTKSIIALYQTCSRFANIVRMRNVVKECNFSLNTLANAKSLTSNFFRNVANHLRVLNLSAAQDLTKTLLLPVMKKLKNLYSLDVTYTPITVKDLLDIHKVCPTMKSIAINLTFTNPGQDPIFNLSASAVTGYQNLFKHFENVHFVYDYRAWCRRLVFILLSKAHLKSLTGTTHIHPFSSLIQDWDVQWQEKGKITSDICESLNLRFSNVREDRLELVMPYIHFENTEYLMFSYRVTTHEFKCRVVCTPLLRPFFRENFGINAEDVNNMLRMRTHDNLLVVMFWKQDTTVFDDVFFSSLFNKLQPIVPINFMPVSQHSSYRNLIKNWVYLKSHVINANQQKNIDEPVFKKKRLAPQSVVLDCDEICRGMRDVILMVSFATLSNPVTLSSSSAYLKELTQLFLFSRVVYDSDFFNILFRTCNKLETIDVDLRKTNNSASFSKSVALSNSLKNLRLVADSINFATIFSYLSQCRSLENIHIDETTISNNSITELANPRVIFVNCTNLYNFTIYVRWPEKVFKNNLKLLKKIKADLGMDHLHVNMIRNEGSASCHVFEYFEYSYDYHSRCGFYRIPAHRFLHHL